jgi:hypothetical protein
MKTRKNMIRGKFLFTGIVTVVFYCLCLVAAGSSAETTDGCFQILSADDIVCRQEFCDVAQHFRSPDIVAYLMSRG